MARNTSRSTESVNPDDLVGQPDEPEDTGDAATDEDHVLDAVALGLEDGPVTFSRPGVESMSFQVKDGKISTTKERHEWLLTHVVGTR